MQSGDRVRIGSTRGWVTLAHELGQGANGVVFAVVEDAELAIKIYRAAPQGDTGSAVQEIARTLTDTGQAKTQWIPDGYGSRLPAPVTALPVAPVFCGQEMWGVAMNRLRLDTGEYLTLEEFIPTFADRLQHCLVVACELARDVAFFHQHELVIGDMSTENIFVRMNLRIAWIDLDSFNSGTQDSVPATLSRRFTPGYAAPEIFRGETANTRESDLFTLAIHVATLLSGVGMHPFGLTRMGSRVGDDQQRILEGSCWLLAPDEYPRALVGEAHAGVDALPGSTRELVRRALGDGLNAPEARPPAMEWYDALTEAVDALPETEPWEFADSGELTTSRAKKGKARREAGRADARRVKGQESTRGRHVRTAMVAGTAVLIAAIAGGLGWLFGFRVRSSPQSIAPQVVTQVVSQVVTHTLPPAPTLHPVIGTVADKRTGHPVRGVRIQAGAKSTTTDANGIFSLKDVPANAALEVVAGCAFESLTVKPPAEGDPLRVRLPPRAALGSVSGDFEPIPLRAFVSYRDRRSGERRRLVAPGGGASVYGLCAGDRVTLSASGYESATAIVAPDGSFKRTLQWRSLRMQLTAKANAIYPSSSNTSRGFYAGKRFHITMKRGDYLSSYYAFDRGFANVTVDVLARKEVGSDDRSFYGLVCRSTSRGAYVFKVRADGQVAIDRITWGNASDTTLVDWRYTSAVRPGSALNRIRAVCTGRGTTRLRLIVNGTMVAAATDTPGIRAGRIGIIGGGYEPSRPQFAYLRLGVTRA